jgi:hypothetical protein
MNGTLVMDVLATHPYVIRGRSILKNPYYVAPINVLKDTLMETGPLPSVQSELLA